ncbi:MAG: hypothetical protein H7A51_18815 [Akkermansiaceae bacterium]|nr:hypothetical protein [Akkermansiaceae bacterium]
MKQMTTQELDSLCRNGTAIDSQGGYPCVVIHPDQTITKIWAIKKRFFSSNTLSHYATRFVNNAARLAALGIRVPEILEHAKVENSHIRVVKYKSLPGKSMRELLKEDPDQVDIPDLCRFIFSLHELGILYRSIHLGNIIQTAPGEYGLIDFTDVKFYNKPVPLLRRAANLAFPLRYDKDAKRIKKAKLPKILKSYLALLKLDKAHKKEFKQHFKHYKKR